jgi:GNAT superfamily N-acetyltransferase
VQELVVTSINDLTERHAFGAMASARPASFQLFSLRDDARGLWTAEEDGGIVGSAFSWVCDELWFLAELFIAPQMQGSGIGRELLRRTLTHADQAGAKTRALITFTFNTVSQGLYIRHGMFPRLPIYMMKADHSDLRVADLEAPLECRVISPSELGALAALDRSALGVSREKHHLYLLAEPAMTGVLFYDCQDCIGYAYVASTGHIGPVAVTRPDRMGRALETALRIAAESQPAQLSAFLPGNCEAALNVAAKHRMRITFPMVLVSDREFGDWRRYLSRNPGYFRERPNGLTPLEDLLRGCLRPSFTKRADADARSVIGIDEGVRGDFVIDLEQPQFARRQPGQCLIDVGRKDLPARSVMQFDDMAFGVFENLHRDTFGWAREALLSRPIILALPAIGRSPPQCASEPPLRRANPARQPAPARRLPFACSG